MLLAIQIVVAVCLITAILMQSSGTGLGSGFGGGNQSYHSRRGVEKLLFRSTIGLTLLFLCLSLLPLLGIV